MFLVRCVVLYTVSSLLLFSSTTLQSRLDGSRQEFLGGNHRGELRDFFGFRLGGEVSSRNCGTSSGDGPLVFESLHRFMRNNIRMFEMDICLFKELKSIHFIANVPMFRLFLSNQGIS